MKLLTTLLIICAATQSIAKESNQTITTLECTKTDGHGKWQTPSTTILKITTTETNNTKVTTSITSNFIGHASGKNEIADLANGTIWAFFSLKEKNHIRYESNEIRSPALDSFKWSLQINKYTGEMSIRRFTTTDSGGHRPSGNYYNCKKAKNALF